MPCSAALPDLELHRTEAAMGLDANNEPAGIFLNT